MAECQVMKRPSLTRRATMGVVMLFAVCAGGLHADEAAKLSVPIGMTHRIDQHVLPGPELEPKPVDDQTPIIVRIVDVFPHGSDFRYDIEFYGLEAGDYNLIDFLQPIDGSSTDELPRMDVEIASVLPPGQVEPHEPEAKNAPRLGGYLLWVAVLGCAWILGLLAMLLMSRKRSRAASAVVAEPVTLADRLRPMITKAVEQRLASSERAELERLLIAHWRDRLSLQGLHPAEAIAKLKQHEEAGALLNELEVWLHRREPPTDVDIPALLAPYQNVDVTSTSSPTTQTPVTSS